VLFKHRDVVNGVDCTEGIQKPEGEGVGAGFVDDLVGPEILVGELLRGTGGSEVLSFDVYLLSNLEVRSRESVSVGGLLIA